jgi:hypothetical protein
LSSAARASGRRAVLVIIEGAFMKYGIIFITLLMFLGCASTSGNKEPTYLGKNKSSTTSKVLLKKQKEINIAYVDLNESLGDDEKLMELFNQMKKLNYPNNYEVEYLLDEGRHVIGCDFESKDEKLGLKFDAGAYKLSCNFEAGKTYTFFWEEVKSNKGRNELKIWIGPIN